MWASLPSLIFHHRPAYHIDATVDAQGSHIQGQIIVAAVVHVMPCVFLIISLAHDVAAADVFGDILEIPVLILLELKSSLEPCLPVRVKENAESGDPGFLEDEIRAAADYDAGLLGQVDDDLPLSQKDIIVGTAVDRSVVEQAVHKLAGPAHILALPGDLLLVVAARLGRLLYEILVVVGKSQPL